MVNWVLIVLGVVALIIVVVIILYILSKIKGKILIQLSNFNYAPGDSVTGKVVLKLKKPVQAKALKVGLMGIQKNTTYSKGSRSTKENAAFDFKQPLDGEKEYPAGAQEYDFSIKIPKNILANSTLDKGAIGTLVKSAQILSGNVNTLSWYITSNLEMPGFDISKKVQINIG